MQKIQLRNAQVFIDICICESRNFLTTPWSILQSSTNVSCCYILLLLRLTGVDIRPNTSLKKSRQLDSEESRDCDSWTPCCWSRPKAKQSCSTADEIRIHLAEDERVSVADRACPIPNDRCQNLRGDCRHVSTIEKSVPPWSPPLSNWAASHASLPRKLPLLQQSRSSNQGIQYEDER